MEDDEHAPDNWPSTYGIWVVCKGSILKNPNPAVEEPPKDQGPGRSLEMPEGISSKSSLSSPSTLYILVCRVSENEPGSGKVD